MVISGATASTYVLANITPAAAGTYSVKITNSAGSTTGSVVLFVRTPAPKLTLQPVAQALTVGDTLTLTATVSGTPPFGYGWVKNGKSLNFDLTYANSITLTKSNIQESDAGSYYLEVAEKVPQSEAVFSSTVAVTVAVIPPSITRQPTAQSAPVNGSASFSVAATGSSPSVVSRN